MSDNSFGRLLRVTTFGESHGPAIGCVVDGRPPGIELAPDDFAHDLARPACGRTLTVALSGESPVPAFVCVRDASPPGSALAPAAFAPDVPRRATGRSRHTSQRREADEVDILSGVPEGRTTGTPIALLIRNT